MFNNVGHDGDNDYSSFQSFAVNGASPSRAPIFGNSDAITDSSGILITSGSHARLQREKNSNHFKFKIDGIPEITGTNNNAFMRYQAEIDEIKKILTFIKVDAEIVSLKRLGKYCPTRHRKLIAEVRDSFTLAQIMRNARNLRNYSDHKVYINPVLMGDAAVKEKELLNERWRLITQEHVERRDISIRRGQLYVKRSIHKMVPKVVNCEIVENIVNQSSLPANCNSTDAPNYDNCRRDEHIGISSSSYL